MKTVEIKTAEPFNKIFPIDKTVLTSVIMDMRKNGFDPCHPVIVWQGKNIVIDGHTRLEAARLVGLPNIPVVERDFQDEDAAVEYAIRCQRERRNLTDADIMRLVEQLDLRRQRGGDHTSEKAKASLDAIAPAGKSADETARIIGTSPAKVEKVRAIQAKAAPEVKSAVAAGKMSINAAAKTTRKAKPKSTETAAIPASDGSAASAEAESEEQCPVSENMPRYLVTVAGRNIKSIQKKIETAFGKDGVISLEKVRHPSSRAERLEEASSLIEQAKEIVQELQGEMENWSETMPDNLKESEKGEQVSSCNEALQEIVDALENVDCGNVEFPGMY